MAGKADSQPTLEEQIATLQAQLAALLETGGAAAATAARERAGLVASGIADEIRARPFASIAVALALGWLVGRVASR